MGVTSLVNIKLGFGQTGPYSTRGGYDVVASAMFGLMSITGYPVNDLVRLV